MKPNLRLQPPPARARRPRRAAADEGCPEFARLVRLVETAGDLVIGLDRTGAVIVANESVERAIGHPRRELLGRVWFDLAIPEHARTEARNAFERVQFPGGGTVEFEGPVLTRSGDTRVIAWRCTAEPVPGSPLACLSFGTDITDSRVAESSILIDRQRHALFVERTPLAVIEWDEGFRVLRWNPAAERIFGWSATEALGRHASFIVPAAARDHVDTVWEAAISGRGGERSTNRNLTRDGRLIDCEWYNTPIAAPAGEVIGVVSLVQDVTERNAAAAALHRSEAQFRAVFDQSFQLMGVLDLDGRVTAANRTAMTLAGCSEADVVGKPFWETPWWTHSTAMQRRLRDAVREAAAGGMVRFEATHPTRDGDTRWIDFSLKPALGEDGRPCMLIPEGRDITDRKRYQEAMRALVQATAGVSGEAFFHSLVQHLSDVLGVRHAFVGEILDTGSCVRTISVCSFGRGADNFEYEITGTPSARVVGQGPFVIASRACEAFPDDPLLPQLGIESCMGAPLCDAHGKVLGVLVVMHDRLLRDSFDARTLLTLFAERAGLELGRLRSEASLRLAAKVFEHTSEAIYVTDASTRIVSVNPAVEQVTGYTPEELIGKKPGIFRSGRHDAGFYRDMWASIRGRGFWQGEVWNRRRNGELYPQRLTINRIADERGELTHYIATFTDISARKQTEQHIQFLAHHDPLTGLPNRVLLQDRIVQALAVARRNRCCTALMFLDLDRFKVINDTLGHDFGDALLKEIAVRLRANLRETETVARLGGDEFVIVLPGIPSPEAASHVAQKLLELVSHPVVVNGQELFVTPSIGISVFPGDGEDPQTLLKHADAAMYHAKDGGRNGYQFYAASMNASALERLALENELRHALERGEFVLHYQPQVEVRRGAVIGAEALIRWRTADGTLIPPGRFIPIAEESGLIVPIGEWVIREACRQARLWQQAGHGPIRVGINLSVRQLHRPGLVDAVARAIAESGADPRWLELEVTESMLMQDVEEAISALHRLADMGLQLSIDDFGTGYSSLAYLQRLPIHRLKIDQSFVRALPDDRSNAAIVTGILSLAHSLDLRVIAEGVETEEQLRFLSDRGCVEVQGYHFSPPVPADDFVRFRGRFDRPDWRIEPAAGG